jgi:hypothetical protein
LEVDDGGSELCTVVGFGIIVIHHSSSTIIALLSKQAMILLLLVFTGRTERVDSEAARKD